MSGLDGLDQGKKNMRLIQYREKNGPFKSIADLKKVPGIDPAKIDAKKDRITF